MTVTRLADILNQITIVLSSLETLMNTEQQQLSAGQVNGTALQRITEDKRSLLATLDYLDTQRQAEQQSLHKYPIEIDKQWQEMQFTIQRLHHLNQHNGWLLESQREYTELALAILKPHQAPELYGADGQAKSAVNYVNKKLVY